MNLRFRLHRTIEEEDASGDQMREWTRQYESFVAARRTTMPRDLWRCFGSDAFHDGLIERIIFDAACQTVTLRLTCPNVKYFKTPDADFEFVNVDFIARFTGVYRFVLERENEALSRNIGCPTFLYGEVETATDEISEAVARTGEEQHSLIIMGNVLRAGLIFQDVHVRGAEPTATKLMMRDPRFEFPFQR